jgi:hypothetical protein
MRHPETLHPQTQPSRRSRRAGLLNGHTLKNYLQQLARKLEWSVAPRVVRIFSSLIHQGGQPGLQRPNLGGPFKFSSELKVTRTESGREKSGLGDWTNFELSNEPKNELSWTRPCQKVLSELPAVRAFIYRSRVPRTGNESGQVLLAVVLC